MLFLEAFKNDKILLNGTEYGRNDLERIKSDIKGSCSQNLFTTNTDAFDVDGECKAMGFDAVMTEISYDKDTKIITEIVFSPISENLFSVFDYLVQMGYKAESCKSEIGSMVDFTITENKKIVFATSYILFMWVEGSSSQQAVR